MLPEVNEGAWDQRLAATGERLLAGLPDGLLDRADPGGLVSGRNRRLCAGFGELATACYRALGGRQHTAGVERAAALLSLLTKVDDQVIDGLSFHGGPGVDRGVVERRTRAYLAPTLASLRAGQPATGEGRCRLAAELGQSLAGLGGDPARLADLVAVVARGWEVQVRAVSRLGAHPSQVSLAQIEEVTAEISGVWLLMITLVGALPPDAARTLSASERAAFLGWGAWMQRADALADLAKDAADGLISSLPGYLLWQIDPAGYLAACEGGAPGALHELLRRHGVAARCLPGPGELAALEAALAGLGEVPALLRWVHGFLAWRYESVSALPAGVLSFRGYAPAPVLFAAADLPSIELTGA
jgi:hypothetical protein